MEKEYKSFMDIQNEFSEAWREFIYILGKELKIGKLLDWLEKKLNRIN